MSLIENVAGQDIADLAGLLTGINSASNQLSAMTSADIMQDLSVQEGWEHQLHDNLQGMHEALITIDQVTNPSEKSAYLSAAIQHIQRLKSDVLPNFLLSNRQLRQSLLESSNRSISLLSVVSSRGMDLRENILRVAGESGRLSTLFDIDVNACISGDLLPEESLYLSPIVGYNRNIEGLLENLENLSVSTDLAGLTEGSSELLSLLARTERRIQSLASSLGGDWEQGIGPLRSSICSESGSNFTVLLNRYLLENDQGTGLLEKLEGIDDRLSDVKRFIQSRGGVVADNLAYIDVYATVLEDMLDGLIAELLNTANTQSEGQPFLAQRVIDSTNENLVTLTTAPGFPWIIDSLYSSPDSDDNDFRRAVYLPVKSLLMEFSNTLGESVESELAGDFIAGQFTPVQLQRFITEKIMDTPSMQDVVRQEQQFTRSFVDEISQLSLRLTDQINGLAKNAICRCFA